MDRYDEMAASIIDEVSQVAESQHPELCMSRNSDGSEALIHGVEYYSLEQSIASSLREMANSVVCRTCDAIDGLQQWSKTVLM